jgi:hypothetical protein
MQKYLRSDPRQNNGKHSDAPSAPTKKPTHYQLTDPPTAFPTEVVQTPSPTSWQQAHGGRSTHHPTKTSVQDTGGYRSARPTERVSVVAPRVPDGDGDGGHDELHVSSNGSGGDGGLFQGSAAQERFDKIFRGEGAN